MSSFNHYRTELLGRLEDSRTSKDDGPAPLESYHPGFRAKGAAIAQAVVRHYPRVGSSPLPMATRKRTYIIKCTITVLTAHESILVVA